MLTDLKRIFKSGFLNFLRNGFVSLSSVIVITITLFVIGSLLFFSAIMNVSLQQLESKVDIDVYFTTQAPEADILSLKQALEVLPEVSSATYTSREETLAQFQERHADDFLTLQALEELEENPLGASLNIKAKETAQYESIARFLENQNKFTDEDDRIIDSVNFYQNEVAIDRLTKIINGAERLGLTIVILLAFVAIIITFNTIRLAIYTSREEISVMRLVGAEKKYVRGPFMVEGLIYGVISALIALALFVPATWWIGNTTERFFGGINIYTYYLNNFGEISLIIVATGILLGVVSSSLAVRRYISKKYLKT